MLRGTAPKQVMSLDGYSQDQINEIVGSQLPGDFEDDDFDMQEILRGIKRGRDMVSTDDHEAKGTTKNRKKEISRNSMKTGGVPVNSNNNQQSTMANAGKSNNSEENAITKVPSNTAEESSEKKPMYDGSIHRGPFSVFVVRKQDSAERFLGELSLAKILQKHNLQYKEIRRITRNKFEILLNKINDVKSVVDSDILKNAGLNAFIPRNKVSQRGIIRDIPDDFTPDEIVQAINNENTKVKVSSAFRLKRKVRNDPEKKWQETRSVCLEFVGDFLPSHVFIMRTRIAVVPYVSRVPICYKCGKIGHISNKCASDDMCLNCGDKKAHLEGKEKCENTVKCVNCQSDHHTLFVKCPVLMKSRQIHQIMAYENLSYVESARKYENLDRRMISDKTKHNFPELPARNSQNLQQKTKNPSQRSSSSFAETLVKKRNPVLSHIPAEKENDVASIVNILTNAPEFATLITRIHKAIDLHLMAVKYNASNGNTVEKQNHGSQSISQNAAMEH